MLEIHLTPVSSFFRSCSLDRSYTRTYLCVCMGCSKEGVVMKAGIPLLDNNNLTTTCFGLPFTYGYEKEWLRWVKCNLLNQPFGLLEGIL